MGLMLSILVSCVGVIELITFYQNISRHLRYPPQRGDFTVISDRYVRELGGIPKRPNEDFRRFTTEETHPPALRLNSHEAIEIEYTEEIHKSRSPSPRRFLVTEKEGGLNERERSRSPRKFVVTEEPVGLKKTKSQNSIPEFLIQEGKSIEEKPRYILKEKQDENSPVLPLPRQFIVSEQALNTVVFDDTDFEAPVIPLEHENSPFLLVDTPVVPRNSICTELIEGQGDESPLKSFDPLKGEKVDVIRESSNYNTTQYWTNKVLVVPSKTSRSRSASPDISADTNEYTIVDGQDIVQYDKKYLNDLDGVSKAKNLKRFGGSRKSVKKRNAESYQDALSEITIEDKTAEVLKHAAEELKKVSSENNSQTSEPSTSTHTDPKTGEPFWVKL